MTALDLAADPRDGLTTVERALLRAVEPSVARQTKCRPVVDAANAIVAGLDPDGVYDVLVRMTVPHLSRYELLDGWGNFGSIDEDPPAASKYSEVRRSAVGESLLGDAAVGGPVAAPCTGAFPAMLVNGTTNAAGSIPPHNLREVVRAITARIEAPERGLDGVLEHLVGPDYPTGAWIPEPKALRGAYATGQGEVVVRAVAGIEPEVAAGGGHLAADGNWVVRRENQIVITALPYLVAKGGDGGVIKEIVRWVNSARGRPVADIRDESDRSGMRVIVTIRRSWGMDDALHALYAASSLEVTLPIQLMALDTDGRSRQYTLLELIDAYIAHQRAVRAERGVAASEVDPSIMADLASLAERFGDERRTVIGPR